MLLLFQSPPLFWFPLLCWSLCLPADDFTVLSSDAPWFCRTWGVGQWWEESAMKIVGCSRVWKENRRLSSYKLLAMSLEKSRFSLWFFSFLFFLRSSGCSTEKMFVTENTTQDFPLCVLSTPCKLVYKNSFPFSPGPLRQLWYLFSFSLNCQIKILRLNLVKCWYSVLKASS